MKISGMKTINEKNINFSMKKQKLISNEHMDNPSLLGLGTFKVGNS
jgi:hypothetical protein